MSILSICFCGGVRKRCTSNEYVSLCFFHGEIRKRGTSNEYPQHMFFVEK